MDLIVSKLSGDDVLQTARNTLGLPVEPTLFGDALIAALLRRQAGISCPCSRASILTSTIRALAYLLNEPDIEDRVESVLEGLIAVGDLLEMADVTVTDEDAKSTWVFLGPPAFVVRPNGSAFICGITPDEALPLPPDYQRRVNFRAYSRWLKPDAGENIGQALLGFGFVQHSERAWLRTPVCQTAQQFMRDIEQRLSALPRSGDIEALEILDTARPNTYYRGRWTEPKKHSGLYIGRRKRDYGSAIWGVVSLENGSPLKFLDLPLKGSKWRACDVAWHIQMAFDSLAGNPQVYRSKTGSDGVPLLDFYSPIPQWAQRRLAIVGETAPPQKCLFSFKIAIDELRAEEKFLSENVWLSRRED